MGVVYMYRTVAMVEVFCGGFFLSSLGVHAAALDYGNSSDRSVLSPR